jgi:hypothetical protein
VLQSDVPELQSILRHSHGVMRMSQIKLNRMTVDLQYRYTLTQVPSVVQNHLKIPVRTGRLSIIFEFQGIYTQISRGIFQTVT